ncbi:MAG: transposase [Cyanobacteria bacterium P01_A01_bin.68]
MTQPKFQGKYRIESTRLPDRDYAANGWYFLTICTKDCIYHFGNDVVSGQVQLTPIGEIAQQFFLDIPKHAKHTYVDSYVVMPNHVHGIVVIDKPQNVETRNIASHNIASHNIASLQQPTDESNKFGPLKPGSLQAIIHSYKSAVTRWCGRNGYKDFKWQERFYESIIRANDSIDRIRQYINNNPAKWEQNKNNLPDLWM